MNLLPPNTTQLEKKITEVSASAFNLNGDLSSLIRIDDAPSDYLSILAWQFSVDRWQDDWPDEVKRAQIKNSIKVHQHKGTNYALRKIVESFGFSLQVHEWWQETPMSQPGTFQITIETNGHSLSEKTSKILVELLKDAKPLTRELKGIEVNVIDIKGETNIAAAMYCGEDVTIYPKIDDPNSLIYPVFAFYEIEITSIYPR
ncbi:MAG: phage tail protein I [Acinetobacter amyesii]|uniref:phage tail protein I n=1 Tax=Acinetobacter amyesii TaxID=2942470 RepID=UPI003D03E946